MHRRRTHVRRRCLQMHRTCVAKLVASHETSLRINNWSLRHAKTPQERNLRRIASQH